MKVSVCITVRNEEKSISRLLQSLLDQSKKPDEIVIVDGGSSDKTVEIIRHWQKKDSRIKLLIKKTTRAEGRNISIELAKNEIIAVTDGDCIAKYNWLKRITGPLLNPEIDISAGFYKMVTENSFQKAESVFLGVLPTDFDILFLPSTRSIAFRKSIWEKLGGFPEKGNNSAEDTDFNVLALQSGAKFARVKNAQVEWRIPKNFRTFIKKIYSYAKWDARNGVWIHPLKGKMSHNVRAVSILFRYLIGIILLVMSFFYPALLLLLALLFLLYISYSFRKVYLKTGDWRAGLWGILIQFASDFAVMSGLVLGITNTNIPKFD